MDKQPAQKSLYGKKVTNLNYIKSLLPFSLALLLSLTFALLQPLLRPELLLAHLEDLLWAFKFVFDLLALGGRILTETS